MRTRTAAAITLILAASVATVTTAAAAPAAMTLPAATAPYRIGFAQSVAGPIIRSIFSAKADGSNPQPDASAAGADDINPAYSPDGSQLAYAESPNGTGTRSIFVADADGSNARQITAPTTGDNDDDPSWSPDGSMIAFDRFVQPIIDIGIPIHQLFIAVLGSGVIGPLLVPGWAEFTNPAWSPTDPGTIVATGTPNSTDNRYVVRISVLIGGGNVTASAVTMLTDGEGACQPPTRINSVRVADVLSLVQVDPALSPDGGTVVYLTNFSQRTSICLVNINGTNERPVPITNLSFDPDSRSTLANPAFSPDGAALALELDVGIGPTAGPSILALTLNGPPATATSATQEPWIGNAAMPAFDISSGPVSLLVAANPIPGYVGGAPIAVTYTLRNQTARPLINATLVAKLPAGLPLASSTPAGCTPAACALGNVPSGGTVVATFNLTAQAAVSAIASGTVTFTNAAGAPTTIIGQGPVVVIAPEMKLNPEVGTPGIVTVVTGIGFPPKAIVRFRWDTGITVRTRVKVRANGTFTVQMLVLPNDLIGGRMLVAHGLSGTAFGDVSKAFLVQLGSPEPPRLIGRG